MRFQKRDASSKRKYSKISLSKRRKLIESVINNEESLIKSTKKLNINLSTARLILKLYKQTGSFRMKNFKHPPKEDQSNPKLSENSRCTERQEDRQELSQNQDIEINQNVFSVNQQEQINDTQRNPWQFYYVYYPYVCGL